MFLCYKSTIYINLKYICDDIIDCPHGEDETNCSDKYVMKFHCHSINYSINFLHVCDYNIDCPDKSDETLCGNINHLTSIFSSQNKIKFREKKLFLEGNVGKIKIFSSLKY